MPRRRAARGLEGLGWAFQQPPRSALQVNLRVRGEEGSWLAVKMEINI